MFCFNKKKEMNVYFIFNSVESLGSTTRGRNENRGTNSDRENSQPVWDFIRTFVSVIQFFSKNGIQRCLFLQRVRSEPGFRAPPLQQAVSTGPHTRLSLLWLCLDSSIFTNYIYNWEDVKKTQQHQTRVQKQKSVLLYNIFYFFHVLIWQMKAYPHTHTPTHTHIYKYIRLFSRSWKWGQCGG